jgi:hypothetical protein
MLVADRSSVYRHIGLSTGARTECAGCSAFALPRRTRCPQDHRILHVLPMSFCTLASRTVLSFPSFLWPFGPPLAFAIVFLKRSRSASFSARSLFASSLAFCRASASSCFFCANWLSFANGCGRGRRCRLSKGCLCSGSGKSFASIATRSGCGSRLGSGMGSVGSWLSSSSAASRS